MNTKIRILISLAIASFTIQLSACSAFKTDKADPWYAGSEISYVDTTLSNSTHTTSSEFRNRYVVDTKRASARLNYKQFHVIARRDEVSTKKGNIDNATDSLINVNRNWLGVGIHTNKGTYISYLNDMNSDYWMLDVTTENKIRPKLKLISGFYHFDHEGGSLVSSGGRRSTGVRIGFQYDITKKVGIRTLYERNNNTSDFVEDRLLVGFVEHYK